jgi:glycosyltransferase involved in cell wall biosynthesis
MRKKIAILHYATPPVVGGVEMTIYHHSRLLAEAGYSVDVIGGRGDRFLPNITFHRIPEIDSRFPQAISIGNTLAKGIVPAEFAELREKINQALLPIVSKTQACIVHNAITLHKNLAFTAALKQISDERATKMIAWCHDFAWQDSLYTPDLHPGYPWDLLRTPWPGVEYVVVSEHRLERLATLLSLPPDQIQVITPGVDIPKFLKLEPLTIELVKGLNLLDADPLLLLPARITRRKNIEFGIEVIAKLVQLKPKVKLIVTGPPGPHNPKNIAYLEELQSLAKDLKVSSNIEFLYQFGEDDQPLHIPDECIMDLYQLSDALFFPSRREGFGIPVLEAGLVRLPVFAADIPPINESAGKWAQRFDPDGDPTAVADQIVSQLQGNQAYKLRRRVLRQFSWQNIVQNRLIPLIENSK